MSKAASENPILAYADGLARDEGPEEEAEETQAWVSFRLEEGYYALPVGAVQEVLRVGIITRVPQTAPSVRGVTNMRGRVLPVLDLGVRLGFEARVADERSRILVVPGGSGPVGLLVGQVRQMLTLSPSTFQEPPDRLEAVARFCRGVVPLEGDLLVLLELEPLLALFAT
jgi:purine-binding chemotaxis protein CheW